MVSVCIEGRGIVRIKLFDGIIRELKDVMYVLQLRKNLTSVGALKVQGLRGTLREGVLKMSHFPKYVKMESRRESATYIREENTSRIHAKPKVCLLYTSPSPRDS